jgi:hypothetical protein
MTTALDIIKLALKNCGATGSGQDPAAEDLTDAFTLLNFMIAGWNRKRWTVYHLLDLSYVSDGRTVPYTIGPQQNFNISVRPERLEAAFLRQIIQSTPNQVDFPLEILQTREDYSRVALKQLLSFPQFIFYDTDYPNGNLYPYPFPQANIYELHILVKMVLSQFTSLQATILLPNEYFEAIFYNLSVRLGIMYPISKDPVMVEQWNDLKGLARASLNTLKTGNAQIARLGMPPGLAARPGNYNIYSDQVR